MRSRFFKIRVAVLLFVLGIVVLYAWANVRSRRARNEWQRPVNVAIVLVRNGAVEPEAIEAMRARIAHLDVLLSRELHRYRTTPDHPFAFVVRGPVDLPSKRPELHSDGLLELARHALALSRWVAAVDERAKLPGSSFDSRVYVVLNMPAHGSLRFVEGSSEQGGRVGTLEVDLDATTIDSALFVTAHELFHTLGALDKYDAAAETSTAAHELEIMDRGRVDTLDALRVNDTTAREIGWLK